MKRYQFILLVIVATIAAIAFASYGDAWQMPNDTTISSDWTKE